MPQLPRPHRHDVLIAVAGLLGGLVLWAIGLQAGPPLFGLPPSLTLVSLAAMSAAELVRRTAPAVALPAATAALVLDVCAGSLVATVVMFTDVVYAVVVYGPPALARRLPRLTVLVAVLATLVPLAVFRTPESLFVGLLTGLVTSAPAFTGAIVRFHREEAAAERLRAEQTALLAEMDRVSAVNAERARMARELHDMVANHLSAIAIHSTAALALEDDREASREALGVIRENSVQGLTEMRRLIGILRDAEGAGEATASPTLDGLDALLERARAMADQGFTFVLHDDRQEGAGGALPAPVELAAYRVVQESVTNALKHARPGTVTVRVGRAERAGGAAGSLVVRVTNPLGDPQGPRAPGSGAGLIGMRERVELLHGRLEAGPVTVPGDGRTGAGAGVVGTAEHKMWEVRAELPVEEL
ncbi:histidine kinase [Streptomyces sp. N2-109]|uniref:histidine kinase n=1 Tax=Streptomyces gossypii TaxID=2883101 RepID=A0ABT2JYT8_9ACTN|nr:histidine kinase [Streptomyces gossypii]MCT2592419.1 histidine kinase [Streptomyces gossypii]